MAVELAPVDIAIVGMGWAGGILAKELAQTGLKVVGFERGGSRATRPDFVVPMKEDEIRYTRRHELMQDVTRETLTFRNKISQVALPMRQLGSFRPGEGVGGSGLHWGGGTHRLLKWDFEPRRQILERYSPSIVPEQMSLQDWGLSYADLEPFYEMFERACATSGKVRQLARQAGWRRQHLRRTTSQRVSESTLAETPTGRSCSKRPARKLGYHPYPMPSSVASRPYKTPDGVQYGPCHYCGFCGGYGCQADAKASPHFAMLPLAMTSPTFEPRTHARVLKVNLDSARTRAVGVTYIDARGRELVQPADLVILCAFALGNVHLLLHSGIGKRYDPMTRLGVVGRNYSYQVAASALAFFDERTFFNPFMGSGTLASCIDDFHAANCDFSKTDSIGGGLIFCGSAGAGRNAPLGHRMEKGSGASLQPHHGDSRDGQRHVLPTELSRPRSYLFGSIRPSDAASYVRL